MALITLRQLLDHAAENQYGVPAFNINNMEQGLAILKAADKTDSPVFFKRVGVQGLMLVILCYHISWRH